MTLLENSHDFFMQSIRDYIIADENGAHSNDMSNIANKSKWKSAYINLVQATELLFKEILYRSNPCLICDDINSPNPDKTVSYQQAIKRAVNLGLVAIINQEQCYLEKANRLRNQFVHGTVKIKSEEIKVKFSNLIVLYKKYHEQQLGSDSIPLGDSSFHRAITELLDFADHGVVYRGQEMTVEWCKELKEEIENNRTIQSIVYDDGKVYNRIKFGSEKEVFKNNSIEYNADSIFELEYCPDCTAIQGEYHLDNCDWEVCPRCYKQLLSCDCGIKEYSE